jgi:predicted esterase
VETVYAVALFRVPIILSMNTLSSLFYITLLAGCDSTKPSSSTPSHSTDSAWSHGNQLDFDGLTRSYSIYTPTDGEIRGLMVVLHGSGDSPEYMISELDVDAIEENGLIVAVPAGVDYGWNDEDPPGNGLADDVGFIDALVAEIKAAHPSLPTSHIFAHGFSNGGGLATRLACESSQIRGIGVVGNYYMPLFEDCPRSADYQVPGWFGAGLEDELVRVESVREGMSSYVADLTDCPSSGALQTIEVADMPSDVICKQFSDCDLARLCEYDDRGHEVLPDSFSAAWHFLNEAAESSAN